MLPCGNIVLVGLSGAGKTSCAQILAGLLDLDVADTDEIIQKNTGKTVERIFAEEGEGHFRALERQLIEELLKKLRDDKLKTMVLSVGGGLPAQEDNMQLLKKLGFTVFLNANPQTLAQRLSQDLAGEQSLRPLLSRPGDCKEEKKENKEENLAARLGDQLAMRRKYYEEAHLVINTDGQSKQDICREIQTIIVNNSS